MTVEISGTAAAGVGNDLARELKAGLRGRLVQPTEDDYDEARLVWNGMVDKRPALIAHCAGRCRRDHRRQLRAQPQLVRRRARGRTQRGRYGVCDGGLVIDLSLMNSVRVDPGRGIVRAEGGVTIGQLDHETQAFGLAVPMGVATAIGPQVSRLVVDSVGCAASMGSALTT
jgi:hypothetical protein